MDPSLALPLRSNNATTTLIPSSSPETLPSSSSSASSVPTEVPFPFSGPFETSILSSLPLPSSATIVNPSPVDSLPSSSSFPFALRISSLTGEPVPSADTLSRSDGLPTLESFPLPDTHTRTLSNLLTTTTTTIVPSDVFSVPSISASLVSPPLPSPLIDDLPFTEDSSPVTIDVPFAASSSSSSSCSSTISVSTEQDEEFPYLGISLEGIYQFMQQNGGYDSFFSCTTHDVCPLVKRITVNQSYCSMHENNPLIGNANIFVSHAWQYPFLYVVKVLENWITQHQSPDTSSSSSSAFDPHGTSLVASPNIVFSDEPFVPPPPPVSTIDNYPSSPIPSSNYSSSPIPSSSSSSSSVSTLSVPSSATPRPPLIADRYRTFFWFDLFSNSQHTVKNRPFTWWRDCFRKNIGLLGRTLLVLQWNNPIPLTRIWCAWELACTTDQKSYLEICMDSVEETAFHEALINNYESLINKLCDINVEKADATDPNDKNNIYTAIRRTIGFYETNKRITQQMRRWMINVGTMMLNQLTNSTERGQSRLLVNVGRLHFDQGKYDLAEPLLTEAYHYRRDHYGYENEETLLAMTYLGRLYHAQARYKEGEELFTLLLRLRFSMHGPRDRRTLTAMNYLASLYQGQGQLQRAERLYSECLLLRRETLKNEDPDTLTSINNLGGVYILLGKYKDTEPLYREALELRTQHLGEDHPETLSSLNNMGLLYSSMGRNDKTTEQYYIKALEGRRKVLGDNHPDTLSSINNVAGYYMTLGKHQEAEKLYVEALRLRKWILGDDHMDTLSTKNNLGKVYHFLNQYPKSETLLTQAYRGRQKYLPLYHPHTLASMNNLANLFASMGKHTEAEELFLETIKGRTITFHNDVHPDVLATMNNLANLYKLMGKYKKAEEIYVKVLDERRKQFGETNRTTIASMNNLANVYRSIGKYDAALPLYEKALMYRQKHFPPDHPETLSSLHNLASYYRTLGQYTKAETLAKEVLERRTQKFGKDNQATLHSVTSLAGIYYYQKRYGECETLYIDTLERTKKLVDSNHTDCLTLRTYLTAVYRCQGRWDEALEMGLPVYTYMVERKRDDGVTKTRVEGEREREREGERGNTVTNSTSSSSTSSASTVPSPDSSIRTSNERKNEKSSISLPRLYDIAHELGIVYRLRGEKEKAILYLTEAYEGRLVVVGQDHHDTLYSLYSLSLAKGDDERVKELEKQGITEEV